MGCQAPGNRGLRLVGIDQRGQTVSIEQLVQCRALDEPFFNSDLK